MRKSILFLLFSVCNWAGMAQELQKLYYPNGKLAFEGRYTLAWTETEPFEYLNRIAPEDKAIIGYGEDRERKDAIFIYKDIVPNRLYEGKCKFYFSDGSLMAEGTYVNGCKNGDFKLYHLNGKLSATQSYVNGMASGVWRSWDKNGDQTTEFNYKPIPENIIDEFTQYVQLEVGGNSYYRERTQEFFSSIYSGFEGDDIFKTYRNPVLKYQGENISALKRQLKQVHFYSKAYKDGSFKVWTNKQLILQMHFKDNEPDGKWAIYENNKPVFEMEIKNDSVVHAKDLTNAANDHGTKAYAERVKKEEEQQKRYETDVAAIAPGLSNIPSGTGSPEPREVKRSQTEIFRSVQQKASSSYDWTMYLKEHLKYPDAARKASVKGRVIVEFVVEQDGSIANVKVVRGRDLGHGLPEEAIRVVQAAPTWRPAVQDGKAVRSYMTIPINFKE